MKSKIVTIVYLLGSLHFSLMAQLDAYNIIDKSIAYHDPNQNWDTFKGSFTVVFEPPEKEQRIRVVSLNNRNGNFKMETRTDPFLLYQIKGEKIKMALGKRTQLTAEEKDKYRISEARAKMYKSYYHYLYGMPMNLKTGPKPENKVEKVYYNDQDCYKVKVVYKEPVGKDIWYFYFNTETFALVAYQFFHDEAKNDGEYINFEGIHVQNGIRFPKNRTWYFNKDDKLLGTDKLVETL